VAMRIRAALEMKSAMAHVKTKTYAISKVADATCDSALALADDNILAIEAKIARLRSV